MGIAIWSLVGPRANQPVETAGLSEDPSDLPRPNNLPPTAARNRRERQTADGVVLIEDDGKTLWASPTHGDPLELAFLPPGVQVVVAMRPEALAEHPEGEKILDALGPIGLRARGFLNEVLMVPMGVEHCVVGFHLSGDGNWQVALVARLTGGLTADKHLAEKLPNANVETHHGATYRLANEWAYWVPESDDGKLVVVAAPDGIKEIIELAGSPPPLRRDIERLLSHTDALRHVTALLAPHTLFNEGQTLWDGEMAPLREPLFAFLGDELSAAALSLHWDDNFFIELTSTPTLDTSPERAAQILAERVAQIPERLEEYAVGQNPHDYGRRVVARFPGMVRKLASYTRSGFDTDHAVLRCYLPVVAGHNMLMGAELTLGEAARNMRSSLVDPSQSHPVAEATVQSAGVAERLKRVTSLVIARDTLEGALELLSRDIGVEIVILGPDLRADGITRNQSLTVEMSNRPAGDILVEILRLANPDKTAAGPADPRQKLVYVIARPGSGPAEKIAITTRAAAAERGDVLPTAFRDDQP
jgi:hypothetical protein